MRCRITTHMKGWIMKKLDKTVVRETLYIACFVLMLSVIMQLVFVLFGRWDYTVLLGNLLSGGIAIINYLLIGVMVQNAIGKEEKEIKNSVRISHMLRMLMIAAGLILGVVLPCFNIIASIVPYIFPRIAILFRPLFDKKLGDTYGPEEVKPTDESTESISDGQYYEQKISQNDKDGFEKKF